MEVVVLRTPFFLRIANKPLYELLIFHHHLTLWLFISNFTFLRSWLWKNIVLLGRRKNCQAEEVEYVRSVSVRDGKILKSSESLPENCFLWYLLNYDIGKYIWLFWASLCSRKTEIELLWGLSEVARELIRMQISGCTSSLPNPRFIRASGYSLYIEVWEALA